MRRLVAVLALAVCVALPASSAQTVYTATVNKSYFIGSLAGFDSTLGGQAGGYVVTKIANDSLKVGDVVFDTASNRVAKSATLAMYNKIVGVVVGGARTSARGVISSSGVGTLAATANQRVVVLQRGRAWMKSADSVYFGQEVIPSTAVAGTFKRRTTAIDSLHRIIGRAVFTKDSGQAVLVDVTIK